MGIYNIHTEKLLIDKISKTIYGRCVRPPILDAPPIAVLLSWRLADLKGAEPRSRGLASSMALSMIFDHVN